MDVHKVTTPVTFDLPDAEVFNPPLTTVAGRDNHDVLRLAGRTAPFAMDRSAEQGDHLRYDATEIKRRLHRRQRQHERVVYDYLDRRVKGHRSAGHETNRLTTWPGEMDGRGRLPKGTDYIHAYDALGRRTSVTDSSGFTRRRLHYHGAGSNLKVLT